MALVIIVIYIIIHIYFLLLNVINKILNRYGLCYIIFENIKLIKISNN